MRNAFPYYRPLYTMFATGNLVAVLYCHLQIPVRLLMRSSIIEKIAAIVMFIPAVIVLAATIRKYFMNLSGIDVLLNRPPVPLQLETTGLHRYMRHPLYSGTLLVVWSIFVWQPSIANLVSCTCITIYTRIGIYFEEKKLLLEFGEEYKQYRKKVPMLLPRV